MILSVEQLGIESQMGSSKMGHSLSSKELRRHRASQSLSKQCCHGNMHLVEMAHDAAHFLGYPLDNKICQQ